MKNTRIIVQLLTLFALILCGNTAVRGQDFIKAAGQTYYLDLDTKEGAASEWRLDDIGAATALRATVSIPRVRQDLEWSPNFVILLRGGDQSKHDSVGVRMGTPDHNSPLIIQVVQNLADGSLAEVYRVGKTLGLDEKIDIEMDWSSPEAVTIRIGASSHTLKIPSKIERVQIFSSTGEMIIDPLLIGRFKHKFPASGHWWWRKRG